MKVGMNLMLWTTEPHFNEYGAQLDRLAELGYDAVEIPVYDLSAEDIERYAKRAAELKMEAQAIDVFTADIGDMIGHDPALRRAAVERCKVDVHKARDLGSRLISGPFFQGLCAAPTKEGPTREEWNWAVEGLRAVAEEAKACGNLLVAAEPLNRFEMHIVNTLEQADALCRETGMDNLGLLADTNHANIEELDVVQTCAKYAKRIFNVHVSENNRGIPGTGHGVPKELFKALEQAGYAGNLIVEAFNCEPGEVLPLLRIWTPFAKSKDEICEKSIRFIRENM